MFAACMQQEAAMEPDSSTDTQEQEQELEGEGEEEGAPAAPPPPATGLEEGLTTGEAVKKRRSSVWDSFSE